MSITVRNKEAMCEEARNRLRGRITAMKWEDMDFDAREICLRCVCMKRQLMWFKADVYMSSSEDEESS
jgi:hypothetical protein